MFDMPYSCCSEDILVTPEQKALLDKQDAVMDWLDDIPEPNYTNFKKLWNFSYFHHIPKDINNEAKIRGIQVSEIIDGIIHGDLEMQIYVGSFKRARMCAIIKDNKKKQSDIHEEIQQCMKTYDCLNAELYKRSLLMSNIYRGMADLFPDMGRITISQVYVHVEWLDDLRRHKTIS